MTTTVAVHQPNYLPYIGFFHKMSLVDIFVLYDTAQYSKNYLHNRNRIKTPAGVSWITVPIRRNGLREIRNIEIDVGGQWNQRHWKKLDANYARADCFDEHRDSLRAVYEERWTHLAPLNDRLIEYMAKAWGFSPRIVRASELPPYGGASTSEKLAHLVRSVGGDIYVSGVGGLDYLDPGAFSDIELRLQDFRHPEYRQLWGPFIPNLSAIDLLLTEGERGREMIEHAGRVKEWPRETTRS